MKPLILLALFALLCSCGAGKKIVVTPEPVVELPPQPIPEEPLIKIETAYGPILVQLYKNTPQHRDNFVKLMREEYYDSLLFHRVIPNFMIQGGDPHSIKAIPGQILGRGEPDYTIESEFAPENIHLRGTIAAARKTNEVNPNKESSGSQFYIVIGDEVTDAILDREENNKGFTYTAEQRARYKELGGSPHLDQEYTVFGEVVDGMDVIEKIANTSRDQYDRPDSDIWMRPRMVNN